MSGVTPPDEEMMRGLMAQQVVYSQFASPVIDDFNQTGGISPSGTLWYTSSSSPTIVPITSPPHRFKVGDRVVLRPDSEFYHQAPDGCRGTIDYLRDGSEFTYHIKWDNGHQNDYRQRDIAFPGGYTAPVGEDKRTLKEGDIVKVIDIGGDSPQYTRDNFIGLYYRVEQIDAEYPLGWFSALLRSTDPARAEHNYYFGRVRLQKFIKPEEVKSEDPNKVA